MTLCEAGDRFGGQLTLAAAPPGRAEFAGLARDLATQVSLGGISVRLNCPVDEAMIVDAAPDAVILATGAKPLTPPIPGVELAHVVQAWDVLNGKVHTGEKVVIIGGGAVGVEVALFLAERGPCRPKRSNFYWSTGPRTLKAFSSWPPGEHVKLWCWK